MNTNQLLSDFQFFDKYSRFNHDLGRRETWAESVQRSVDYLRELSENRLEETDYEQIKEYMLDKKAFPSMRLFAMAGEAARRDSASIYNCSAIGIDGIDSMVEVMALCMAGCGVGFSVENRWVSKMPVVEIGYAIESTYVIPDSTDGWLGAFRSGLEAWFSGDNVEFNYSNIRPAGSVLKIKGGRASGPQPLMELLDFSRNTILMAQGRQLTSVEVYDIVTKIADCVVSGGVRRSALICLFDYDDEQMRHAKDSGWWKTAPQRANANNSIIIERELSYDEVEDLFTTMHQGGGGEPGLHFRKNVNRMNPERRKDRDDFLLNPCFAPGTKIQTKLGHYPIESLVGKEVDIWDGNEWVKIDNFRITGKNKEVFKIKLYDGSVIHTTGNHRFVLENGESVYAQYLMPGDRLAISNAPLSHGNNHIAGAYLKGFLCGDGTHSRNNPVLWLYDTKYICKDRLKKSALELSPLDKHKGIKDVSFRPSGKNRENMRGLSARKNDLLLWTTEYKTRIPDELFAATLESKLEFIAGVMDADGTQFDTSKGFAYQISSVYKKWLIDFQALLKTIGVNSHLSKGKEVGMRDFGDGYGSYLSKRCWRLTISQVSSIALSSLVKFTRLPDFSSKSVSYKVKPRFNKVVSVEKSHIESVVYCCTVDSTHQLSLTDGIITGQCGEINLRGDGQLCNLTQAITRPDDTLESLADKVRIATIIGTIQSLSTNFPFLRSRWKENSEEERLLGVDVSGQMDAPHLFTPDNLDYLRHVAIDTNKKYAEIFGINQSAAVTCNKPSGNSSLLFDASPGLHSRWSDYYIRRFRVNAKSPMRGILEYSGMKLQPENGQQYETATTFVAEFPVKAPDGAITNGSRSAVAQCEWWKMNKLHWTEHNPSVTILYNGDELPDIVNWVYINQNIIGGMAFLPRDDHHYPLAPYEKITKEEYDKLIKGVPEIDWEFLLPFFESDDNTTAAQELACMSGSCEL